LRPGSSRRRLSHLAGRRARSEVGAPASAREPGRKKPTVQDANDIAALAKLPMLISAQGGDYTRTSIRACAPRLAGLLDRRRVQAWHARKRRHRPRSRELPVMQAALAEGVKDFIGGNCHGIADADGGGADCCGQAPSIGSQR